MIHASYASLASAGKRAWGLGVLLAALGACSEHTPGDDAALERSPDGVLASDPRVAPLVAGCPNSTYYDRFLDDIAPILIEKLESAGGDPLKHAKQELGLLGEPAVEPLRRLVDRSFADAFHGPRLENAIDALSLNETDAAHDVLIRTLNHPMESVRQRAMRGLIAHHRQPEDFDLFLDRIGGTEPIGLRRLYVAGIFAADPVRAERLAIEWFASGAYQGFWNDIAPKLQLSRDPQVQSRCAQVWPELGPPFAVPVAAPAARGGDVDARVFLRSELDAEDPSARIRAVRAIGAAGLVADLESVVTEDPDETVRVFALEAIAEASTPDVATRCDWLRPALEDESPVVRAKALELACGLGDPRAIDRAIADLGENPRRLQAALLALRDPLADPALSERAYAALLDRNRLEEHRPLIERGATFKAMGIVQLQKAARFLRDMALANLEERIEGLRAHEWLMIQASNTGPAGRIWLWEQLEVETDPLRRIDLISASCSTQDPDERAAVRNRLLVLAEDDRRAVGERLYAADRAAKIGPAWIVAPRLRLVANSTQETRLQLALQCLLWHWY